MSCSSLHGAFRRIDLLRRELRRSEGDKRDDGEQRGRARLSNVCTTRNFLPLSIRSVVPDQTEIVFAVGRTPAPGAPEAVATGD